MPVARGHAVAGPIPDRPTRAAEERRYRQRATKASDDLGRVHSGRMVEIPPFVQVPYGGTCATPSEPVCRTFPAMVGEVDPKCVALRLRTLMIDLKLATVQEFADFVGTERSTAQTWLRARNYPRVPDMARVCEKAGVTLDWIYRGVPEGLTVGTFARLQAILEGEVHAADTSFPRKERRRQSQGQRPL